jgi:hypothetical protein
MVMPIDALAGAGGSAYSAYDGDGGGGFDADPWNMTLLPAQPAPPLAAAPPPPPAAPPAPPPARSSGYAYAAPPPLQQQPPPLLAVPAVAPAQPLSSAPPQQLRYPSMLYGSGGQQQHYYYGQPMMRQESDPGYFDLLWQKRRELFKLCALALVILLAISSHSAVWHYLQEYVDGQQLEGAQELAIRLAYPAAVLLVLWNVKTFFCGRGAAAAALGGGA